MKGVILFLTLLQLNVFLFGGELHKGYYVNQKNQKLECTFDFKVGILDDSPDYIKERFKVDVIINNDIHKVLTPDSVKYFVFMDNEQERKFVSVNNDVEEGGLFSSPKLYIFMEQIVDGYLKLFIGRYETRFVSAGVNGAAPVGGSSSVTNYFIRKNHQPMESVVTSNRGFRETFSKILEDNPMLVYEIKQNKYSDDYLISVVKKYNEWKNNGSIVPIDTNLYSIVDVKPRFNEENIENLADYIKSKIEWPKDERETKIVVQAIVELNGRLNNIKIRGFKNHSEINEKIKVLLLGLNNIQPAKIKEMKVRSVFYYIY